MMAQSRFAVDLHCDCDEGWYAGYFFDDEHLGFICQSCWKEWLIEEFVQVTDEKPVCHKGKTYLSPKREIKHTLKESEQCQVTTSRAEIIPEYAAESLKRGDHIMWWRPLPYWHHAIVENVEGENITLIHFSKKSMKISTMETTVDITKEKGTLYLVHYSDEIRHFNPVELVLARAKAMLGIPDYNLLQRNCENFATFCKTGVDTNQQSKWLCGRVKEILKDTIKEVPRQFIKVGGAEILEGLAGNSILHEALGAGVFIVVEGLFCYLDIAKLYDKRKKVPADGKLGYSRKNFIQDVAQRLTTGLFTTTLGVLGGLSTIWFPGAGLLAGVALGIMGGMAGVIIGHVAGAVTGPFIARNIAKIIKTDDRPVALKQLHPGDHVVFYGKSSHPRCHAIVTEVIKETDEIVVVRHSYKNGVIHDIIKYDKDNPFYKVEYPENLKKLSPEDVVKRALEALENYDKSYNLLWNNCKHFVCSITLKP